MLLSNSHEINSVKYQGNMKMFFELLNGALVTGNNKLL